MFSIEITLPKSQTRTTLPKTSKPQTEVLVIK